jgi:lipopolysaccharide export system permease protein
MRFLRFPTLWRYLLKGYIRVFLLSVVIFLAVLLVMRFKEIARFTALSGCLGKTVPFILYQFPLILPIAIPISALIASFILFQRLNRSHELVALRACGLSLYSILAPLLFASALIAAGNFSMSAEIAPRCRCASKSMLYHETSVNPLLLLQRQQLIRAKHAYLDMAASSDGSKAKNVTMIAYNESNHRLALLQARELSIQKDKLLGRDVAFIFCLGSSSHEEFDSFVIENQYSMYTAAPVLSELLKKSKIRLDTNALTLRSLILRMQGEEKKAALGAYGEILRRLSLSLAVFSFTCLGCVFGIENSRVASKRGFGLGLALMLAVLIGYLTGKELKTCPFWATIVFLIPHLFIWIASIARLKRIAQGKL